MELLAISGRQLERGPQRYGPGGLDRALIELEAAHQLNISDPIAGFVDLEENLLVFLVLVEQAIRWRVIPAPRGKTEGIVIPVNKPIPKAGPLDDVGNRQPELKILGDPVSCIQADARSLSIEDDAFPLILVFDKMIRQVNDEPQVCLSGGNQGGFSDRRQTEDLNHRALVLGIERGDFSSRKKRRKT